MAKNKQKMTADDKRQENQKVKILGMILDAMDDTIKTGRKSSIEVLTGDMTIIVVDISCKSIPENTQ